MSDKRRALAVAVLLLLVPGGARSRPAPPGGIEREVESALAEVEKLVKAGQWTETRVVLARAEGRLGGRGSESLRRRLASLVKDVEMVTRLDEIRLARAAGKGGADARYSEAFRAYGIVPTLKAEEAVGRLRRSAVRQELLAGLDAWAMLTPPGQTKKALQALADGADDNAWRKALRQAVADGDAKKLGQLASEPAAAEQPPAVLVMLAEALSRRGQVEQAVKVLRQGLRLHPGDFWLSHQLAGLLLRAARSDEAAGYFRAALALRPDSPPAWAHLGQALMAQGRLEEAIACYRKAIALDPSSASAHLLLGHALRAKGEREGAIAAYRKALQLQPDLAAAKKALEERTKEY